MAARLAQTAPDAARRMAALLVGNLSLDEIFVSLCDLLGSFVEATSVEVAFRRGDRGWVLLRYSGDRYFRDALPALPEDDPCGRAAREGVLREQHPAAFALPLVIGDEIVGAVSARSDGLNAYDDDSEALVGSIAPYIAVALQQRILLDAVVAERFRAEHDPLTKLANRALFASRFEQALLREQRTNREVGLLYLDLDRFKPVNDQFGHEAGDLVLRVVAERLQHVVRDVDTVARIGGDEFAILLEDVGEGIADVVCKVKHAVELPIAYGDAILSIGVSIGTAVAPRDGRDSESLMQRADEAMYRQKTGRA